MEEANGFDVMEQLEDGNHTDHHFHVVSSPNEIQKLVEEADKKYQLRTLAISRIKKDITQRKADKYQINLKLMWFSKQEYYIRRRTQEIMDLESRLVKAEIHLPKNVGPRRTGFSRLPQEYETTPFRPDRKRCQKMLIKKEGVYTYYLEQVHDELLSSKKSHGITPSSTKEVNNLVFVVDKFLNIISYRSIYTLCINLMISCIHNSKMESMAQRIQHGNKNRADEMRIYNHMRKVKETGEMYTAPEPNNHNSYPRERNSKRDIDSQRFIQHKINILLDEIEEMKMDLKERKPRFARLTAELKHVRKSITCLKKELKRLYTKRSKAYYKQDYELGVHFNNTQKNLHK
uniref:Uncharacterized protein n=1 Tax=Lactuca sativa TaxID=4236 RepID=A0A9R1WIZ7_LACSA|nr:hypothetical protein LSAT_V11C100038760 [Lactuca sativa]